MIWKLVTMFPKARRWVRQTHDAYVDQSKPIASLGIPRLPHYFSQRTLDETRIVFCDPVPQPPIDQWRLSGADEFQSVVAFGATYLDTIFINKQEADNHAMIFHELVHAVQWRTLGTNRFLIIYGFDLLAFDYIRSPLEQMAFTMQARYDADEPFDAESQIAEQCDQIANAFRSRSLSHRIVYRLGSML